MQANSEKQQTEGEKQLFLLLARTLVVHALHPLFNYCRHSINKKNSCSR